MQKIFQDKGIKVHRPAVSKELSKTINTPLWTEHGVRNCLSPRDSFAVIGNVLLEAASHKRSSQFESLYYKDIFIELFKKGGKWISMPTPALSDNSYDSATYLTNIEPILDTAQIARFGNRLLISTSGAGNLLGVEWIERMFNNFEVIRMNECFSGHLDAQIKIIRPGLVISPYPKDKHPDFMKNWDIVHTEIYNGAPEIIDERFQDDDWDNTYFQTSMLSYDENTIFVFDHYKKLFPRFIKEMEKKKVECIFIPFKNQHWFSQGSTCITCDVNRSGSMENYA
jgi:N-dimethylarginine dimethylaminohydrolase